MQKNGCLCHKTLCKQLLHMFNCFKTIFAFGSFFKEGLKFKEVKRNKQGYRGTLNIFLLFYYPGFTQWCKMPFKKRMAKFEWENAISSGKIKVSLSLQWIQVISDAAAPNYSLLKSYKKVHIENSDLRFAPRTKADTNSYFPRILVDKWVGKSMHFFITVQSTVHLNNNNMHKSHKSII